MTLQCFGPHSTRPASTNLCLHSGGTHTHTHTHRWTHHFFLKPCTKNRTPQTAITNVHPSRNTLAQKNTQCLCASPCSCSTRLHPLLPSEICLNLLLAPLVSFFASTPATLISLASIFMRSAEGLPERGGYQSLIEGGSPSTSSTLFCQVAIS